MVFDRSSGNIFYENANGDATNTWPATSGPWGNGQLDPGNYAIYPPATVPSTHPNQSSFCDSSGNCWWSKLDPFFDTSRTGLGIHPDGNVSGTAGCVGATSNNTSSLKDFLKDLTGGPTRPTLEVR